jgi:hypothetical protein
MTSARERRAELSRMQEARRQTRRQLDMIDRQITRRITALIPRLKPQRTGYRRGVAPDSKAFLDVYRSNLAAITAERQPEIDALARQDAAIDAFSLRHGLADGRITPRAMAGAPCDRNAIAPRSLSPCERGHR